MRRRPTATRPAGTITANRAGAAAGVLTTARPFARAIGIAVIGGVVMHTVFHTLGTDRTVAGYPTSLIWVAIISGTVALAAAAASLAAGVAHGGRTTTVLSGRPGRAW